MPFVETSMMDSRRRLVLDVASGMPLSAACRQAGVTRRTGRKWVNRAREQGIEGLCELSRAPHRVPRRTAPEIEEALVALKAQEDAWGAKKLVTLLRGSQGIELPLRTADRILQRHGLVRTRIPAGEVQRFEREPCGALLQMDFKGLPKSAPYSLLTVLDDCTRFCLHFAPLPDKTGASVSAALWEVFGEHGLPDEILSDNGDCWGSPHAKGPTRLEAWLMRLGIHPIHGRPSHPQTQGKVERFHQTAKLEAPGGLVHPTVQAARLACQEFVAKYNWIRPHEALGQEVPGSRYEPWRRTRPSKPPPHEIPQGALTRKVQDEGIISFRGSQYNISKGLLGESVVLIEEDGWVVTYAGFRIFTLPKD